MDLISPDPIFNLYNDDWPILKQPDRLPPAKFVFDEPGRTGMAVDSMVCAGVIVSGGVGAPLGALARGRRRAQGAEVEGSVLLHGVDVGERAVVRRAIVDKNVRDRARGDARRRPRARPRALRRLARRDRRRRQGRARSCLS